MKALVAVLRWFVPFVSGALIGAVILLSFSRQNAKLYSWLLVGGGIGIALASGMFVVFQSIRVALRSALNQKATRTASKAIGRIYATFTGRDLNEQDAELLGSRATSWVQSWTLGLTSIALIGLAVTLAGTLVLLGQTIAAYEQVDKLSTQNTLLDQQNVLVRLQLQSAEANSSRAIYAAQLDSLTRSIDEFNRADQPERFSRALTLKARISAAVSATTAYKTHEEVAAGVTFSPERGQLLALLLSSGITGIEDFDFSGSDLTGLSLQLPEDLYGKGLASTINLQAAMLRTARIGVDFDKANLRGAWLPKPAAFRPRLRLTGDTLMRLVDAATLTSSKWSPADSDLLSMPLRGADLAHSIVPTDDWLLWMRERVGARGIESSLWVAIEEPSVRGWKLALNESSEALAKYNISPAHSACARSRADSLGPHPDVSKLVKTINAQRLVGPVRHSQEKGSLVLLHGHDFASCVSKAGADFSDAFLGFELPREIARVDGLDLSKASFRGASFEALSARGAVLPDADEFAFLTISSCSTCLQLEGAIVMQEDWLRSFAGMLFVSEAEGVARSLVSSCGNNPAVSLKPQLCAVYTAYELDRRTEGGYVVRRK